MFGFEDSNPSIEHIAERRMARPRGLVALAGVWLAVVSSVADAQFSPPPQPPPSPPPPSPNPPSPFPPPTPSPPPATGFAATVHIIDNTTDNFGVIPTTSNCCQWYKWCENTNIAYQCTDTIVSACRASIASAASWNDECKACMMCYDSRATDWDARKKSWLSIYHPYQACIDTTRKVMTQAFVADPHHMRVEREEQTARDAVNTGQPQFIVCGELNYKCLKIKNPHKAGTPCEVIPGVKVPNKFQTKFGRMYDQSSKDPRKGPQRGRLLPGAGMVVNDAMPQSEVVADMADRDPAVHPGFEYPLGVTKGDGTGVAGIYQEPKYVNTSDPLKGRATSTQGG